ncbi:hypothetical protein [Mesoterricola silvestris]|uniref:Lipoprotein n=1 Tax=Mesoterricola silvestris TaxID=2927979 RepID=A0AA48GRS5_9BACT|nr:hypothetical protein [Mesoterricola silvestris]BDU74969.1 hypothetical protein METEAL_41430 [Mesoterricola silvestris]
MNLPRRILGATLGGAAVLALALACGRQRSTAPDWVGSAPAGTVVAMSGQAGWLLEQRSFQTYLAKFPYADQTLDLFLKKARIDPHLESGRINFYVLSFPDGRTPPDFLIQLGGFKDQRAVQMAITEAFPAEGSLPVRKKELPVYVILDVNQFHIRAVADPGGRIWLGDLRSLARLDSGTFPPRHPVLGATEWINARAPFQGFIQTRPMLEGLSGSVPPELARNLPQGIDALAWSVTPGDVGRNGLHRFELSITGSPEGVVQVAPWVQRFVAVASTLQGGQAGQAPEILQERKRIGLRCQLTGEQINQALARLSQPGLSGLVHRP